MSSFSKPSSLLASLGHGLSRFPLTCLASPQPPLHWRLFFYSLFKLEFSRPLLWTILFSPYTSELTSLTGQCIRTFM